MTTFLVMPFMAQEPSGAKPIAFVVGADYDGETRSAADADVSLVQQLEAHGWGPRIQGDLLQAAAGAGFEWLQQAATVAEAAGIALYPAIGVAPPAARAGGDESAASDDAARLPDVERAAAVARALAGHRNVQSYVIDAEAAPAGSSARPSAEAAVGSAAALTSVATAIRARHPSAAIVFGGLAAPDADWADRVCAGGAGRAFSGVRLQVDATTALSAPGASAIAGLAPFVAAVDRACGRKRIWVELTVGADAAGLSERDQAASWVRGIATLVAAPRVEQIAIRSIRDRGPRPGAAALPTNDGLVRADGGKKLAFFTIDLLTDLLGTETITVEDRSLRVTPAASGGELHAHLFGRPDGDKVLLLWNRTAASTVAVQVPGIASSVEFDIDGRPLRWDPKAEALTTVALAPNVPRIFRLAPKS